MRAELTDHKTGWFSVALLLKEKDIDALISALQQLKQVAPTQHFHVSNQRMDGSSGLVEFEFIKDDDVEEDTFSQPSGFAIAPD
jgi:hypothetical protein